MKNRNVARIVNSPKQMERLKKKLYLTRNCGQCTECCHVMEIPELKKPANQDCPHLMTGEKKGCAVYEDRPYSCREWACVWRSGSNVIEPAERPDRVGVMFDTLRANSPVASFVHDIIICYETRAGGHLEAADMISRIAKKRGVVLVPFDTAGEPTTERKIVGPDAVVRPYIEACLAASLVDAVGEEVAS